MTPRTRADLERLVTDTVCQRLHVKPGEVTPSRDLRTIRAFSSFVSVDILESLEAALQVDVPAGELSAERLCSVAALTELFLPTLATSGVIAP